MKRKPPRSPQTIPQHRAMKIPRSDYQPSRAELREETEMPKLSLKQARSAFMRPFRLDHGKID